MRRVLLAVDASSPDLTADDGVLAEALRRRCVEPVPHRWGEPIEPDEVVLIRSTWDYVERPEEFAAWLDHLDARRAVVVNPTAVVRWNMHKGYLLDLARAGVPIVPTVLVRQGADLALSDVRTAQGWDDVVVKPAIGGTARLAVHSGLIGADATDEHFRRVLAEEDVIVQPAIDAVRTGGEISVVAIGGEPRAAFEKRAAPGEWRVQSEFGGTTTRVRLTDELVGVARSALATSTTDYGRVDVVRHEGRWAVLELELVEPELFFLLDPSLADQLADRITSRLAASGRAADASGACHTEPMAATDMTDAERDQFLSDVRVGILSIERHGKGPLALPVWYQYADGEIVISMGTDSAKAKLLRRAGRASLTVQDERPPYRYVAVEGPVTVTTEPVDVTDMAIRYLGPDLGRQYAAGNPPDDETAVVRLTPERWLTCDYGKTSLA